MKYLTDLEKSVHNDTLISLIYIAGYIQKCDKTVEDTTFYYTQSADFFEALNRGGLQIPNNNLVQWTIFCLILFEQLSGEAVFIHISEVQVLHINPAIQHFNKYISENLFLNGDIEKYWRSWA